MSEMTKEQAEIVILCSIKERGCLSCPEYQTCDTTTTSCRQNVHEAARTLYGNERQRSDRDEMAWQFYKDACATAYSRGVLINKSGEQLPGMMEMSYSVADAFLAYRDRQNGDSK